MTPTDPRLRLAGAALPFFPKGSTAWPKGSDRSALVLEDLAALSVTKEVLLYDNGCLFTKLQGELSLDVSAPGLRDGFESCPDMLPWLLKLLAKREKWRGKPTAVRASGCSAIVFAPYNTTTVGEITGTLLAGAPRRKSRLILNPWPDLSGLDEDEKARAIVAAALSGGPRG